LLNPTISGIGNASEIYDFETYSIAAEILYRPISFLSVVAGVFYDYFGVGFYMVPTTLYIIICCTFGNLYCTLID